MAISFSPPLGETVVVGVAPHSSTVELRFTATFASQQDYDEAKRDGVKVEIWTNLPTKTRDDGGWQALAFQESAEISDSAKESAGHISLVRKAISNPNVLHLHISVPLNPVHHRFEYTHRLVYPSGQVKWLGKYACNGVLVFNRMDPRFVPGKRLLHSHSWKGPVSPGPGGWDKLELARLSPHFDWSICAMDNDGSTHVHSFNDIALPIHGCLISFVPIIRPQSVVIPQAFSLACTQGASMSVNAHGVISITGPGEGALLAQTYDLNEDANMYRVALRDCLVSCSLQHSCQILDWDSSSGHAILTSQDTITTKKISIIPFAPAPSPPVRQICVRVSELASLTSTATSQICLFSRPTLVTRFLSVPSEQAEEASITLLLGLECSQFTVAPVYNLGTESWQASVITPHTLTIEDSVSTIRPPTPPPSPPVQPIVTTPSQQQSCTSIQSHTIVDAPERVSADPGLIFKNLANQSPTNISWYISYMISFAILLLKLILLRMLIYVGSRRLPYKGFDKCMDEKEEEKEEGQEVDDSRTIICRSFSPLPEEDTLSASTAADAEDSELGLKGGRSLGLLFDVAAGNVSILLRSNDMVESPILDLIRIELDGKQVEHGVLVLGEGTSLVEFNAEASGRVSILL